MKNSVNNNFIEEISKYLSGKDEIDNFINYCNLPLKKSIRIQNSKINVENFLHIVNTIGYKLTNPNFVNGNNDSYYIDRDDTSIPLGKTFFHQSGFFYIQELAAGLPAKFLELKNDDLVLDISSAPGGKTIQISDYLLMNNKKGFVVSNDVNKQRISATAFNINRMGAYNTGLTRFNGFMFGKSLFEFFDHVLVDAPCSGEGTGFKSDSALKFWHKNEINKIAGTQFQLLVSALKSVKPGGTVVYSTCTLNPYENELVISKILDFFKSDIEVDNVDINGKSFGLKNYGGNELNESIISNNVARFWPHIQKTGGFFICKLKKLNSFKNNNIDNKLLPINPFKLDYSTNLQKKIIKYLNDNYSISFEDFDYLFVLINDKICVTSRKFLEIKNNIQFEKIGVPIIKIIGNNEFVPLHSLGTIFGHLAKKNFIELEFELTQKYSQLEEISVTNLEKFNNKYIIIKRNGFGISVGKVINGILKNKYLR